MNKSWSSAQLDQIWSNYLNGKMLTLFPLNLTCRDSFAKHYEGVSLNGKWVKVKIALFALSAICPQCGKLMHHDFYEEPNFPENSWSVDFQDNNFENLNMENLWPMHDQCIAEKRQALMNWKENKNEKRG